MMKRLTPPKRESDRRISNFFQDIATNTNSQLDKLNAYQLEDFQELREIDPESISVPQLARVVATLIQDKRS